MLLGVAEEGTGVGSQVLRDLGVESAPSGPPWRRSSRTECAGPLGQLPFTPRGKRVLELSLKEAQDAGHSHIGPSTC